MSLILCKLPKAGLGNQLFPLMKAFVFSYLNNFPVIVTGYNRFTVGPYLRREKSKRKYTGYFTFQKDFIGQQLDNLKLLSYRKFEKESEPSLQKIIGLEEQRLYVFNKQPDWSDYFYGLKEHRVLVKQLIEKLITPSIRNKVYQLAPPCIGVHMRMGDFKKLQPGDDFSKLGVVRTPEEYFVSVINQIRLLHGSDLPVSIFTDGHKHEIRMLMSLRNTTLIEGNPDIADMLLLSRSKIIITSAGSTFSYWSGFLSDCPLIMHHDHIYKTIRPESLGLEFYEGKFDCDNPLLVKSIKQINS